MTYDPARGIVDGYKLRTVAVEFDPRSGGPVQPTDPGDDVDDSGADDLGWAGSGGGIGTGDGEGGFPWILLVLAGVVVAAYVVGGRDEEDEGEGGTGLALPLVGVGAAGAGLYYLTRRGGDMPGPVTGSGNAVEGRYATTRSDAHRMYAAVIYRLQGWDGVSDPNDGRFMPPTWEQLRFFDAWRVSEGGKATWNPLNTTWRGGSIKTYNSAGVGQYATEDDGVIATFKTINLRYYRDLKARIIDPNATAEEMAASPNLVTWRRGFKPDDGHPYVSGVLRTYPKTPEAIAKHGKTAIPYRYPIYGV